MPLDLPSVLPPLGPQTEPDKVRVAAVVGGMLGAAPARGFGLTPDELTALQNIDATIEAAIDATATAETRSRIVNGAMQISQERGDTAGGPTGVFSGFYPADQWLPVINMSGTMTAQRVQSVTPNGSVNRIRLTVNTADASLAAGEYATFSQTIEGVRIADFRWGSVSAKQIALRFGFKAPAGTYCAHVRNGAFNRTYLANFTIAAGQANTDTEQVLVIPGDVTGTWPVDTGGGMTVGFSIAAGTTYQGVAGWQAGNFHNTVSGNNGLATAGAVFELYDVGLYLDPLATGIAPPWVMPDEAEELRACQRYWHQTYTMYYSHVTNAFGYGTTNNTVVPPRAAPALTGFSMLGSGFPAATGTLTFNAPANVVESRAATATQAGAFQSRITVNARM